MKNLNPLLAIGYIIMGASAGYLLSKKSKKGEGELGKVAVATVAGGLIGVIGAQIQLMADTTIYSQQAKLNEELLNQKI